MLFEVPNIKEQLAGIVQRVSWDPSWNDDLMQEALIHLWQLEEREPGHTLSWYLQSCLFHLRHYVAKGRSLDSWKRCQLRISIATQEDDEVGPLSLHSCDSTVIEETSAREMIRLLRPRLPASQQSVLTYLADGLSSREVGRKLGVCHKTVTRQRRQIATTALELGIVPVSV